ncbi:MAG TPA: oligosaccharide flippase family protein [Steroidobacteraceae bacterium]|jgi:O-antigen/teichoic acid export membrane protein|nr:oligosaccharide flippase family protein [Steroidobacteraceae bacterium]
MAGVGNRAAILTLSRLANYGLMLISPVILVRLLTVAQFGRYREFLLYASVLQSIAMFSINDSLLYCIPSHPASRWRTVRQTTVLMALSSLLTVAVLAVLDRATGGRVVGSLLLPICLYTLLSSNLDFWDFYWVATERPGLIFVYTSVRLGTRVAVVLATAALTHDVLAIIWALIVLEGVRVLGTALVMAAVDRGAAEPPLPDPWREQLHYCLPSGAASVLSTLNRSLGALAVTKALGAVALAQYTIARYGEPVVVTLRNSVSSVVLPEMVRRHRETSRSDSLALWKQATVTNTILLFPVVVIVIRFARPLVETVFGRSYAPAALVLQIYMLAVVRECFDFAPALRAINCTRPLVGGNVAAIIACGVLLAALIPVAGLPGAMTAAVLATLVEAVWLGRATMRSYGVGLGELLPWANAGKVAAAALLAAAVLATSAWSEIRGPAGMALGSLAYLAAFTLLLLVLRVPEAYALLAWARRLIPSLGPVCRKA